MRSVQAIKRKFGSTCFERWGKEGGSPVLKAYAEGRVTIHGKRKRRKK